MAWVLLVVAGLFEVVWAIGLKYTEGFTRPWPSVVTAAAMIVSVVLLALGIVQSDEWGWRDPRTAAALAGGLALVGAFVARCATVPNPVLAPDHWRPVVDAVTRELVTPVGLRSLSPRHPDFKPTYHGDLLTRDAAYHQGTVWSWLIGPYVDAVLRVHADVAAARRALDGLIAHLGENCIGFVGEVFDAEPPYTPGGCVAQAWGVAELLRCLLLTER